MNVLIVGAGIAGLATYRALRKQGIKARIIEKNSQLNIEGAAICLPANAMLALQKLELSEQVKQAAHQVTSIEYALSNGSTLAKASLSDAPCNKAPFVALMRHQLMSILAEGVDIEFSKGIDAIVSMNTRTEVQFSDGEHGCFDLVIGADGINSTIRTAIFANAELKKLAVSNWRFIVDKPQHKTSPVYYIGDDSAFMSYPISEDKLYCYGQILDKNNQYLKVPKGDALKSVFQNYCAQVKDYIELQHSQNAQVIHGELKTVTQTKAVKNCVVILGDALHGCPPSLQQGAGLAFEDANCLAEQLATNNIAAALQLFEKARLPRVKWVVKESNKIIKLAGLGRFSLGRWLRNRKIIKQGPANVAGWKKLLNNEI